MAAGLPYRSTLHSRDAVQPFDFEVDFLKHLILGHCHCVRWCIKIARLVRIISTNTAPERSTHLHSLLWQVSTPRRGANLGRNEEI